MIQLCSIASGSSGNCIYIGTDEVHLLIDAGISGKRIKAGLDYLQVDPGLLDAILITHEHSDHISGLGVMSRKYHIPIYLTEKTWNTLKHYKTIGQIDEDLIHFIQVDSSFRLKDCVITPFKTFHDAVDSVCYTFQKGKHKVGFVTDTGSYNDYIVEHLRDSNILYIESNHDVNMLQVGAYPYYLKQRILSDVGHLSNELSSTLIREIMHEGLQYIILAHLSKENNHPDLAYITAKITLEQLLQHSIHLCVAKRDSYSEPIIIM